MRELPGAEAIEDEDEDEQFLSAASETEPETTKEFSF